MFARHGAALLVAGCSAVGEQSTGSRAEKRTYMLHFIVSLTLLDREQVGVSLLDFRALFRELLGRVTMVQRVV